MTIELINTGSELLIGQVLNRHQQWLGRVLAEAGYRLDRQGTVPDTAEALRAAIGEALARARLVLVTGGLGPTSDDRTRAAVAELLGRPLVPHAPTRERLRAFFAARQRAMPPAVETQALIPAGAEVFANEFGTAPGLAIRATPDADPDARWLVMLPGPPRELHPMVERQVLPWLRRTFPLAAPFCSRTLRSTGVPESWMQERLEPALAPLLERGLEVAYCARPGEVDVRLSARGDDAATLVAEAAEQARRLVGESLYGEGDTTLEAAVVAALTRLRATVATAESCTGGRVANRLTNVPGASVVFPGGVVCYSNALKERLLGVNADTLAREGAVSEPVARELAVGARRRLEADFALAITGIAGPAGGTPTKPVGTVFLALATPETVHVERRLNPYDRETFKQVTSQQALDLLRRELVRREEGRA